MSGTSRSRASEQEAAYLVERRWPGKTVGALLSRKCGDELCFVMQHRGAMSRVWVLGLTIKGTDAIIDLRGEFSPDAVRQACIARGWRFDKQRRNWRGMLKLSWSPACEYSAGHQRVPGAATASPCGLGMLPSAAERGRRPV